MKRGLAWIAFLPVLSVGVGGDAALGAQEAPTHKAQSSSSQAPGNKPATKKGGAPIQTFTGVISDGQCAANGSHGEVMKKASVNTEANCTKGCARRHGFVLYNPATKKVYKLSDQERPAELAAQKVKITGALDKATGTIYVSSIEPAR